MGCHNPLERAPPGHWQSTAAERAPPQSSSARQSLRRGGPRLQASPVQLLNPPQVRQLFMDTPQTLISCEGKQAGAAGSGYSHQQASGVTAPGYVPDSIAAMPRPVTSIFVLFSEDRQINR
ncbi:hypothetical protein NDU88_004959 [Pleurodeles waltl]|uniref:Uncharacterized protein n=1 Tax=Pleurodeles waltl TaxID=8319 RepID=A0AAV7MYQ1_PLEWA|nr:hypothetical protein NDU88_004959 [Pleurodeles waltl]